MAEVKLYDVRGELSGLVRKVGKSGSESWSFQITGTDLQQWERLKLLHREQVTLTIEGAQKELKLGAGEGEGDEGDEGDEGAADHAEGNGAGGSVSDPKGRAKKEPKGKHAVQEGA